MKTLKLKDLKPQNKQDKLLNCLLSAPIIDRSEKKNMEVYSITYEKAIDGLRKHE
jgi:hypothetical protein